MNPVSAIYHWISPKPKDWGLRDNELDFLAQLLPNSPGIIDGFAHGVEMAPSEVATKGKPGMVVKIQGHVQFGSQGAVDAPLSGTTCAWYRSYVRTMRKTTPTVGGGNFHNIPDIAPSDMISFRHGGVATRKSLHARAEVSSVPFRVGDDNGFVEIDPHMADVDTDFMASNHVERPNRCDQCLVVEWALMKAQRVTLIGTLGPDLSLLPGPDNALLISTKNESQILSRHRAARWNYSARRRKLDRLHRRVGQRIGRVFLGLAWLIVSAFVLAFFGAVVFIAGGFDWLR